jgi:hypothetical protein
MRKSRTPPWSKPNPRKASGAKSHKLTAKEKAAAKTRAKRRGRHYPNLVDNMWAASGGAGRG